MTEDNKAANQIDAEIKKLDEEAPDDWFEQLLETGEEEPINPVRAYKVNRKTSSYGFYQEVSIELRDWWNEFNSELDDTGNLRYKSIIQFAKAKAKTRVEKELILEMVGPPPQLKPGKAMYRVPWLGDWQRRRANSYGLPKQSTQVQQLIRKFKDKIVHWDAIRELTPYIIQEMARYEAIQQEIETMFGGMAFDHSKSPTSDVNVARFEKFFNFTTRATKWKLKLALVYMKIQGVNPDSPQLNMQVNQLTQHMTDQSGQILEGQVYEESKQDMEVAKVARMIKMHATTYNLPLPKTISGEEKEPEPVQQQAEPQVKKEKVQ